MNFLVTGSSGLIGRALVQYLTASGHRVTRLVRTTPPAGEGQIFWNPEAGTLDVAGLEGFDVAVHLAGETVVGRWTPEKKTRILGSRVKGTRLLSETLARLARPPRVLVSASATGYYGERGDEVLREESTPGSMFLSEVCREWEAATEPAAQRGVRVAKARIGFVLSAAGGGLARMLLPFRLGVGGKVGSGRQYMSWIAIDDVVGAIMHVANAETLQGAVNFTAPSPVTNLEFTKTLGRVLSRPTLFPVPAFAVRLVFGQMAQEVLLASTRVEPARLKATLYQFRYPELEGALRHLLGKSEAK